MYKSCSYCRLPFESEYSTKLYCSGSCRERASQSRSNSSRRTRSKRPFATKTESEKDYLRDLARSWRFLALEALGYRCVRCGFDSHPAALQIDHINGDGRDDRRGRGQTMYRRIASGDTAGLQLLCANCHAIKTVENGDNQRRLVRRPAFRLPPDLLAASV
jgi:5-methylcytosine-specific restriction endonuclease McrA